MKIALSCQDGLTISGHAGHCTKFVIYTISDGKIESSSILEIEKERTFHNVLHNIMLPFMSHPLFNVDVIMSGSMGAGFIEKMKIKGIEAIPTSEKVPEIAVAKYLEGSLEVMEAHQHKH
jgi:predicted Fe-Mo cluster-binding NifX family protein